MKIFKSFDRYEEQTIFWVGTNIWFILVKSSLGVNDRYPMFAEAIVKKGKYDLYTLVDRFTKDRVFDEEYWELVRK